MTGKGLYDPFSPMAFPHGDELTIIRGGGVDAFGDPIPGHSEHTIGPCAIAHREDVINVDGEGPRDRARIVVTCPPDSDVKEGDRVRFPTGHVAVITNAPVAPKNPFTGWQPFIKFTCSSS